MATNPRPIVRTTPKSRREPAEKYLAPVLSTARRLEGTWAVRMTPPKLTPCKPASFVVVDRVVTCRHTRRGMINGNCLTLGAHAQAAGGSRRTASALWLGRTCVPEPAEQSRALRDLEVGRRRRRPRMQHARERGREGQRPRDLEKKPSMRGVSPGRRPSGRVRRS